MLLSILGTLVAPSGGTVTLTPEPILHDHLVGSQSLVSGLAIQPSPLTHAHVFASPALSFAGLATLTPDALVHGLSLASPALTLAGAPVLQPATISHQTHLPAGQVGTSLSVTPSQVLHAHKLSAAFVTAIGPASLSGKKIAVLIESLKYFASSTDDGITIVVTRDSNVDVTVNQC